MTLADLLVSLWIIESARAIVLKARGLEEQSANAEARAEILGSRAAEEGGQIRDDWAKRHSKWVDEVAGSEKQTGALGLAFIQRLGTYVDAHSAGSLSGEQNKRMSELARSEAEGAAAAFADGLPPAPPPEWPETPEVHAPGELTHKIGILGDPHVGHTVSDKMIPAAIRDINREQVNFSVVVGDLTQDGRAEAFRKARKVFDDFETPWLVTLGNHDMWGADSDQAAGQNRFADAFGRKPYGIHEHDGIRVVAINSADPTASPFPPYDLTTGSFTDDPNEAVPGGVISPEVADWMNGIEAGPRTFVVLHHPPHPYMGFPPVVFGLQEASTKVLEDFVRRIKPWGTICGHTHRSVAYEFAGVPFLETISSREWPFAYGLVEVSDEGWSFNLKPISDTELVNKASEKVSVLFRRYSQGHKAARAFVWRKP